jgi:glutamyl-tRNA reductase
MATDSPHLVVIGCNHHRTPLEIRERMALSTDGASRLKDCLKGHPEVSEAAVLNTCNRVEIYAVTRATDWNAEIASMLGSIESYPVAEFLRHAYAFTDLEAVQHGYRVAAGLDSQMVGETQILGQMKAAYDTAIRDKTAGPVLHRFFQKSFQAAKWARTETKIGAGQVSLGNVAVELATRIFGRLTVARTLVVGSGKAGRDVAKAFRSRGVACMSIASRTHERAEQLARQVDGLIIPFGTWEDNLRYVDVGIFATSAPGYLLDRATLERTVGKRPRRPLFLIDLAVPRDIDVKISDLPNIYLYNLEDLATIANENLATRQQEMDACIAELDARARYLWERVRLD